METRTDPNAGSQGRRLLYKDLRQRLRVLQKVSLDIAFAVDLPSILPVLTQRVADAMEAEICSLFLRDEAAPNWLRLRAASGYPPNLIGDRTHLVDDTNGGITGFIVSTGKQVKLNSAEKVRAHPAWKGTLDQQRGGVCETFLGCPIRLPGEPAIGTLKVENKQPTPSGKPRWFSQGDDLVLQTICGVLAIKLKAEEMLRDEIWRKGRIYEFFHTFSSPLFSIRLLSEFSIRQIESERGDAAQKQDLQVLHTSATRFLWLVNNSEFWASNRGETLPVQIDLGIKTNQVIKQFTHYGFNRKCTIEYTAPSVSPAMVLTDKNLFELVFCNILQNAIEYGDGLVEVKLRVDSSKFTLEVVDNGPGVLDDEIQKLTQQGFRGQHGLDRRPGHGLGL